MKLILVDCYGFFYKAHYAFQNHPLITREGEDTSVIFSFYNFLHRLVIDRKPNQLICILDSKGPTHRHKLYTDYKAHRPPMPDSLKRQIELIRSTLPLLGLDPISCTGYEADDIIAHYAKEATIGKRNPIPNNLKVEIFSSDKDLFQLVGPEVTVVTTDQRNKEYIFYNIAEVREKFAVKPEYMVDYLALVGDSSDNVPGVKGIGKVTAFKLIDEYGSIESIYAHLDKIPDKTRLKLVEGRENAIMSKRLVTLDYPIKELTEEIPNLEEIKFTTVKYEEIKTFWEKYECFSLIEKFNLTQIPQGTQDLNELLQIKTETVSTLGNSYETENPLRDFDRHTLTPENWDTLLTKIQQTEKMVFDLETTSLDPYQAQIVSLVIIPVLFSSSEKPVHSYYLPLIYKQGKWQDHEKNFLEKFKAIFENPKISKIGHNLKYEYTVLKAKGIHLAGMKHDTMVYEYLMDPDRNHYKLENLIESYFRISKKTYKELSKGEPIFNIPATELEEYTYEDGEYTYLIYLEQQNRLSEAGEKLFQKLEMQLVETLGEMEMAGVWIDVPLLKKLKQKINTELKKNQKSIFDLSEEEFNINSTKQLQKILFEKLKISPIKKTKTGYSTDNYVLTKLAKDHLIAQSLLAYRKNYKLLNTYVQTLPLLINSKTGKIHTHYNQSVAATGRLSSNEPNLQNIPIGEESQGIRQAFIAPPSHQMASIDYSQVELRILAFLSQDETLLQAYIEGYDIHAITAHLIFNKPMEKITGDERGIAKTINFSVIYGISSFSLGEDLNIPRSEAQFFIDSYFKSYPKVIDYQKKILADACRNEFVETYYGRKRYVREINAKKFSLKSRAERIAFNTVIQGTASDIIKMAMVTIQNKIKQGEIVAQMVMQVHDELVFYIQDELVEKTIAQIESELCAIKPFDQILKVNSVVMKSWEK